MLYQYDVVVEDIVDILCDTLEEAKKICDDYDLEYEVIRRYEGELEDEEEVNYNYDDWQEYPFN